MNLYLVGTKFFEYDTFDSHIVSANNEAEAILTADLLSDKADDISVKLVGTSNTDEVCIIHSSFNAG